MKNQGEEIQALREEIAELRKQLSAMAVAMAELAASHPVQYVPYVAPYPAPPIWPQPPLIPWSTTTWTSNGSKSHLGTLTAQGDANMQGLADALNH